MKKLIVLLMFMVNYSCFAQEYFFNLKEHKVLQIMINGISDAKHANYITRYVEKNGVCEFSWIDYITGEGYFIIVNSNFENEVKKAVNRIEGLSIGLTTEIFDINDTFLRMYMLRSGVNEENFSKKMPEKVIMGPNEELTEKLYNTAKQLWVSKFSEQYYKLYPVKNNYTQEQIEEKAKKGY